VKRAFTLLELVFVIVIIGILSALIIPKTQTNSLREAAIQLVSDIRYTQHLAMIDDKFDSSDSNYYLGRWQIRFTTANSSQAYFIMSDTMTSNYDANPNAPADFSYSEVAKDPINSEKYLIGTTYSSFDGNRDDHINSKLNLKASYGIISISVSGGSTGSSSRRIIFDELGRPYRGDTKLSNASHLSSPVDKLLTSRCTITLSNNTDSVQIAVEPETGYTHIL